MDKDTEATYKEDEYTRERLPYIAYFRALEEIFDFSIIQNFADFGCNNGGLLKSINEHYPKIEIAGYDYFDWAKENAPFEIKDKIYITDISKKLSVEEKYDILNCSEVGEHIAKDSEDIFIENLLNSTKDILILTWSDKKDAGGQHLNPQSKTYIIKKIEGKNFTYWKECTDNLSNVLKNKLDGIGYGWWADNIMVFKRKKFANVNSSYLLQGISTDNSSHHKHLKNSGLTPVYLQKSFVKLTNIIHEKVGAKKGYSILRLGDGDYFFLRKIPYGSAKPGKRALIKDYNDIDISLFRSMLWQNDIVSPCLEKNEKNSWVKYIIIEFLEKILQKISKKISFNFKNVRATRALDICFGIFSSFKPIPLLVTKIHSYKKGSIYLDKANKIIHKSYIPFEAMYALVSTKWIFRNYKDEIGIIASAEKNSVIKELMKHTEYKNYIGTDNFTEYIDVPAKGAADDVMNLGRQIGEKIKNSKTKIYLVGAGSSKLALMPLLKNYSDAVFIDVGCGIDAIAGIVCQERPYFAEWTNYRVRTYDYSKIDFMDQGNPAWDNINYKTIYLD
jgi:hypothetical protein